MKKTIIAIAAATSVALTQGVAAADTNPAEPTTNVVQSSDSSALNSSNEGEGKSATGSSNSGDLGRDIFGWKDGSQPKISNGKVVVDENGETVMEDPTTLMKKITDVGLLAGAIVTLLGSISALFANIEKIAKQFTNFGK